LEIKENKPFYNRAQKRSSFQWGIYSFTDRNGYINFSYGLANSDDEPLSLLSSREKAKGRLESLVTSHNLCQGLSGLYETGGPCFQYHVGICKGACCGKEPPEKYNERAAQAIEEFVFARRNFFIIDKGREAEEKCAVKMVNGKYSGYGYFNINDMGFGLTALHECIKPLSDNHDVQVILKQYLRSNRVEKIIEF
jgi:DNA polymerase-3 subunit epsilon